MPSGFKECNIEDPICDHAENTGWVVRKLQWIGRRNAPDRFMAKGGRVVLMEFKAPGEEPRPGQEREHGRLRKAGVEIHVVDSVEEGIAILG